MSNHAQLTIMKSMLLKTTAVAAVSLVALAGCSTKHNRSEVMVAPLGVPGGYSSYGGSASYNGGALVSNSAAVKNQANNIQAVVYFGYDQSNINSDGVQVLNQHVALLKDNPDAKVLIAGHTDERGSRDYNVALGERRAQAVRAYLTSQGIDASKIEVMSYGEEQPAVSGSSEQGYAKNRRAELSY